jgi:hypothetical protein
MFVKSKQKNMKKLEKLPYWEYKIVIDKYLGYSIMDEINYLGQLGWEMVSSTGVVVEGSTTQINYLFKRLKV